VSTEPIKAWVKFQVLLDGIGAWIPPEPDLPTIEYMNAWFGPHWIFVPQSGGIAIYRDNLLVFGGRLEDLREGSVARDQAVGNKSLDPRMASLVYSCADGLTALLPRTVPKSPADLPILQMRVQVFLDEFFR